METKYIFRFFLVSLLMFTCHIVVSQTIKFTRSYGGAGYDEGYSIIQTYDKGYIIAGSTSSYGYGMTDAYLLKIDSVGDEQWYKFFGGMNIDKAYSVKETPDSGLVMAGYTNSMGLGGYDVYVIRTDRFGDTLWTRTYGGADWDFAYSIDLTGDGGYIVAGGTYSSGTGNGDVYLLKIDSAGDTVWTKTHGGPNDDEARSVVATSDGGYVLTGSTKSFGDINGDIYIIKTTSIGDTMWTKKYGGTSEEVAGEIKQASNGEYIVVGGTQSYGVGGLDCYIMRTDLNGDTLWTRTYGSPNYNFASSVIENQTNKIVFSNTTEDSGGGLRDYNLFIADNAGYFIYNTTFGAADNEEVFSISECSDNGYIMCGYTNGFNAEFNDVYIVKTDSAGGGAPFTISVNETANSLDKLTIYPNPVNTSSMVTLKIPDQIKGKSDSRIQLTDLRGQVLMNEKIPQSSSSFSFPIDYLESGIYIVNLVKDGRIVGRTKFVAIK